MPDRTRHLPYALVLLCALAGGCGSEREAAPVVTPMPTTLAGVYSGDLPCSNCAAIATTLWLRPDGRFFLRQRFVDEGKTAAAPSSDYNTATFSLGHWHWDDVAAEVVLRSLGPERRLAPLADERLELRVASPIEHILARDASAPAFTDRLTLDGESAVTENGATFRECLTDLTFTVSESGAYSELRRQHRRTNGHRRVALTTVEGHLATSGRLVIDRFVAIKPGTPCPAARP